MYRLLNRKHFYPSNHILSSTNTFFHGAKEGYKCNYCREMLCDQIRLEICQIRRQSTKAALLQLISSKRNKLRKIRQYGELLEVNAGATNEYKALICNLKATHLSKLISNPSIKLDELHKLTTKKSKKKKTSHSLAELSNIDAKLLKNVQDAIIKKSDNKVVTNSPRAILKEYKRLDDVPLLNMDNSSISLKTSRWHNYDLREIDDKLMNMIKESYAKFRKKTIFSKELIELNQAIDEQSPFVEEVIMDSVSLPYEKSQSYPPDVTNNLDLLLNHPELKLTSLAGTYCPASDITEEVELHEEIHDTQEELLNTVFKPPSHTKAKGNKTPKDVTKSVKINKLKKKVQLEKLMPDLKKSKSEPEKKSREENLRNLLAAHLEMCLSTGALDKAYQIFIYYRRRGMRVDNTPVRDIKLFNILLHGYAAEKNYTTVHSMLCLMKEDRIEPNIQTYAAVFECIQRSNSIKDMDKLALLQRYRKEMESKGMCLNDLMDKAKFVKDQHELVLAAIRRLDPNFTPEYKYPHLDYVSPLLGDINLENCTNREQPKREGFRISPAMDLLTKEQIKAKMVQQLRNEENGIMSINNIENSSEPTEEMITYRKNMAAIEEEWRNSIKTAFMKNMKSLKSQSQASHSALNIYPYMKVLDVDSFVDLIMFEMNHLADGSESYSPSLKILQRGLGWRVYSKYRLEMMKKNGLYDKLTKIYEEYCEWYLTRVSENSEDQYYNSRQKWQTLIHKYRDGISVDAQENAWPNVIYMNVGKYLYNIILNDLKIDANMYKKNAKKRLMPATYCVSRWSGRICRIEMKVHPLIMRTWSGANRKTLTVLTPLSPSFSPPAPWTKAGKSVIGGYLLSSPPLMRMPPNVVQQWKRLEDACPQTLYPSLDSLNQIGSIPWTINQPILDLLLKVFRSGGSKELDVAQPPSVLDNQLPPRNHPGMTKGEKSQNFRKKIAINRKKSELYSLWCDSLYKLSLANHYRNSIFWLPHNMDFRGRMYACPPHVSILGGDSARALLRFALPKPLGPRGLRWLKLHAVNLTGTMKKRTTEERLQYADEILDDILDSADNPLDGRRWWASSEDPWQTLACCMEIANAIKSPNHEEYMCAFPVHQDGSCNGLQHYAALGGDEAGAVSVNLTPSHKPQDVYSAVVALVEDMRKRDAQTGILIAQVLEGFVQRKVIKQTVMTTVYGVTKFGARLQIAKQLKDINDFPKDHIWASSTYLTMKTFDSLREMFTSTKEIQEWFTECAKLISSVCGESVEWVTPLGLPVVQPYYKRWNEAVAWNAKVNADGITIGEHTPSDQSERPCLLKQKNAFPPNYIHSLDSSHMMLTSLKCEASDITFVSVHDCFWTHPSTVDRMNLICRKEFVALHSQPILEDLSKFLVKRYGINTQDLVDDDSVLSTSKLKLNKVLAAVPQKGTFKLENVLDSVYFFS